MRQLFRTIFCDKDGRIVVAQWPNVPGALTISFVLLSWLWSAGPVHAVLRGAAGATGLWWSWLELYRGDSLFRRGLGLMVGIMILLAFLRAL